MLDMDKDVCRSARVVLGGVAPIPWRSRGRASADGPARHAGARRESWRSGGGRSDAAREERLQSSADSGDRTANRFGTGNSRLNRITGVERTEVRRDRNDIVLGEIRNGFLHERRVRTRARPVLYLDELPRDINRLQAGDSRHLAQAPQLIAVTDRAGDSLATAAGLHQRLPVRDAAGGNIGQEGRVRIAIVGSLGIYRNLDDAMPDGLRAALGR